MNTFPPVLQAVYGHPFSSGAASVTHRTQWSGSLTL
jgi:hypothetical protein